MASDYLKQVGAQGHLKVKEVLRKWDPIGVYYPGSTCPDDEYDSYSGAVVDFLDHGSPKVEILRYLDGPARARLLIRGAAGQAAAQV